MLVLARFPNQRIVLSNGVTITVTEISGQKVKLGIDAPPDVTVDREEIAVLRKNSPQVVRKPRLGMRRG